jgi:hypothetical protein
VHKTDSLAELVCSNSFRGDKLDNAVGLLKEEMRRLDSLVMHAAEVARVPAGAALAVDRELFARTMTKAIEGHPLITVSRKEIVAIPAATPTAPVIVATWPADVTGAVLGDRRARRGRASVFLRRHQPDRACRDDRPEQSVSRLALAAESARKARDWGVGIGGWGRKDVRDG